jgi:hypothetical protein
MAKKITIDGTAYTVPDDATLDEVSQIAKPPGVPGAEKTGTPPAGAKPPLPKAMQGPPLTIGERAKQNLPSSLLSNSPLNVMPGFGDSGIRADPGSPNGFTMPDINREPKAIAHFSMHPIDSVKEMFANDPAGTITAATTLGRGLTNPAVRATAAGAGKAAVNQVRPLLEGINPLEHPFKVLPDLYDAGKNIITGGKQGLTDFRSTPPAPNPQSWPRTGKAPIPFAGGSPEEMGIDGGIENTPVPELNTSAIKVQRPLVGQGAAVSPTAGGGAIPPLGQAAETSTVPHPPFAPTAPFSPSRTARQLTNAGTMAEDPPSLQPQPSPDLMERLKSTGAFSNAVKLKKMLESQ